MLDYANHHTFLLFHLVHWRDIQASNSALHPGGAFAIPPKSQWVIPPLLLQHKAVEGGPGGLYFPQGIVLLSLTSSSSLNAAESFTPCSLEAFILWLWTRHSKKSLKGQKQNSSSFSTKRKHSSHFPVFSSSSSPLTLSIENFPWAKPRCILYELSHLILTPVLWSLVLSILTIDPDFGCYE